MSNRFIPKEKLAAFSRWQMGTLHTDTATDDNEEPADPSHPSVQELRRASFQQGHQVGYQQGYAAGLAKAASQGERLAGILGQLQASLSELDEGVAQEILSLSIELSQQIVRSHLSVKTEAILPVIQEALNSIAAIAQHPRIFVHPDDADILQRALGHELQAGGCRIIADPNISKGGARIEDASFEIDATLSTRWKRALAALGVQDHDWLD